MNKTFELKDRNVIEMKTGELLLYVEDNVRRPSGRKTAMRAESAFWRT